MPQNPRRRQRKLERQKAKKKAERQALARRDAGGLAARITKAAAAPILHCCVGDELWEAGIGQVLVSRQLPNGEVACCVFLVDMYCLGVKNTIVEMTSRLRYEERLYKKLLGRGMRHVRPEYARKLVEGAVRYASDLGLSPYHEYRVAKLIFGDIPAEACTEEFTYGKDGRPLFIQGPNDSPARCQEALHAIENHRRADESKALAQDPDVE